MEILRDEYSGDITKKDIMKFLNSNYRGKMDMGVAAKVVDAYINDIINKVMEDF